MDYIPTLKACEEDARIPLEASGSYEMTIVLNMFASKAVDIMAKLALKMINELYKSLPN